MGALIMKILPRRGAAWKHSRRQAGRSRLRGRRFAWDDTTPASAEVRSGTRWGGVGGVGVGWGGVGWGCPRCGA